MTRFNHDVTPTAEGRHPEFAHLVMCEVEPHHSMLILTSPAASGNQLISIEAWSSLVGDAEQADMEFAYLDDSVLDILSDAVA